jgi:hypothetical protein
MYENDEHKTKTFNFNRGISRSHRLIVHVFYIPAWGN